VSSYNNRGKKVSTYPSTMDASRCTGINQGSIANAARGYEPTAGGYFWRYGNSASFDVESFLQKRRIGFKEKKGRKVTQYDIRGNRIACYLTMMDAAKAIGAKSYVSVMNALKEGNRLAFGFIWKSGWGKAKIKVKKKQ
jgi:hypothetical protein